MSKREGKKGNPSFTFSFSWGGGEGGGGELMGFLLAHKLAVRTHGGARQLAESRGKVSRVGVQCTRKSTLIAPGGSQSLHPPPLCPLHICKPFLHLFYSWTGSVPLCHLPHLRAFTLTHVRSSPLMPSHSAGHLLFLPVFLSC